MTDELPTESQLRMEPGWIEHETEQRARSTLAYQRCNLMEAALRNVGFSPKTQAWALAVMVAKISHGWQPLIRDIAIIANDAEFRKVTKAKSENRDHAVRRALRELQKWGIMEATSSAGAPRRRTRPTTVLTIVVDPKVLAELASGATETPEIRTTGGQRPDIEPDIEADKERTKSGQIAIRSICIPLSPNPKAPPPNHSKPGITLGEVEEKFISLEVGIAPALVRTAITRGSTHRQLMAIAKWFERSQRHFPERWKIPSAVLKTRLENARPGVPAARGWIPGNLKPQTERKPKSSFPGERFKAERLAAQQEWKGNSIVEEFRKAKLAIDRALTEESHR
jgi:hypothetical protein